MAIDAARVERVLATIVGAAQGNYERRVPLQDVEDELLEIEVGINFLLDELTAQARRNQDQHQALVEQAERIATQSRNLVAALSTPIIMVWPGVLALPLIGGFDLERATNVTTTLLDRVMSDQASHVILDLTGIDDIETATIGALLRMVRSLRLLGVRCILTGIHPSNARRIVDLGVDLGQLHTLARVSDAIVQVLAEKRAKT